MVNAFKHCCDLNHSTVTIFSDHFEGNWVGKSRFLSEAKPYKCLLTQWLLMTSILFLAENIWRNQFGSNYLKNENVFLNYFLHFRNLHEILNICKKKMSFIADLFAKLRTPKNVVRYMSKKSCFKGPFNRQHGKRVQTLLQSGSQDGYHI